MSTYNEAAAATDKYINQLLDSAGGDRDFAIKQLKAAHDKAVGSDDTATAQFLEKVASDLESKIGRIPYDYQVGVSRLESKANTALDRLSEDEKVWKADKAISDNQAKVDQQESLSKRGILTGTRDNATGLAGVETKKLDITLQKQLDAYDRALGRSRADVNTELTQGKEDLTTAARRGVQDTQSDTQFGTEAAQRKYEAQKAELERQRALSKLQAKSQTLGLYQGA